MLSRRRFLAIGGASAAAAGGGAAAVWAGVLPGRVSAARRLGRCDLDVAEPRTAPGPVVTGRFLSGSRGKEVGWELATPPGVPTDGLPVVLVLHGRGDDATAAFGGLGLHRFLAEHTAQGRPPLALASVDGDDRYWHPREDGDDPLTMLTDELLPVLGERGLAIGAVGAMGWSMGGYGALLLLRESAAGRLSGTRVVAAAASSPALFPSYDESSRGAFDDAKDFARWGNLLGQPGVDAAAVHVSCGDADAFTDATRRYREQLDPQPAGTVSRGCHDGTYWRSVAAAQLDFLAQRLGT
jgi:enterochelin esterase-like enzyme